MADLEEITETPRTDVDNDPSRDEERELTRNNVKRKRSKKRRNSNGSLSPTQSSGSGKFFVERQEENERVEKCLRQQPNSPEEDVIPTQEDHRVRFYEDYRKVAEEYDKEFLKKHDEDLNTTLIFAGLFSAVTSAFITQLDSQLQPDPNDETAALLRLLIYKTDNTTFGNNVPTLLQWTGPPRAMVQVQAILFATLAVSLFSAFLAMLGKQWLNRYQSIDVRGSAIERSHSRQQKLGGVVGWYFAHVMESLPLMLQVALLLFGCALSRYLWEIDVAIALTILSVTSFGVIFYLFIVIAGAASENCPYQTPAAHILRHILIHLRHHLLPSLHSTLAAIPVVISSNFSRLFQASWSFQMVPAWWLCMKRPWYSVSNVFYTLLLLVFLPIAPAHDVYRFGQMVLRLLVSFSKRTYRHRLMGRHRAAYDLFIDTSPLRALGPDQQTVRLDLRCISWILQTSLDKAIHLSTLKHLTKMLKLAHFDPTLMLDCFNVFIGCIEISSGKVVIIQGLEQLAIVSANGFLRTLHYLATMDPTSSVLAEFQRRYNEVFPSGIDFTGLPFHSTMTEIHALASRFGNPLDIKWHNRTLSVQEHIPLARRMAQAAEAEHQRTRHRKVPRWTLRSALFFLSLGPVSPASVVADCLTIIAIDIGCDVSNIASFDESVRVEHVSTLITQRLDTMVEVASPDLIFSKRKAITTLLPYAIFLEQGGQKAMVDAIFRAARASDSGKFLWRHVILYISRLFEKRSPTSLNRVIALISPYVPWGGALNNTIAVARWAAAASAIPYTVEVGQSVVHALLQIADIELLRPHIPIHMWGWTKRQTSFPAVDHGEPNKGDTSTLLFIRALGDIEILKSYFLLIWSDRWTPVPGIIEDTESSIKKDFCGVGMERHRRDLLERLDHILGRLDQRLEDCRQDKSSLQRDLQVAKKKYTGFRAVLLAVDRR